MLWLPYRCALVLATTHSWPATASHTGGPARWVSHRSHKAEVRPPTATGACTAARRRAIALQAVSRLSGGASDAEAAGAARQQPQQEDARVDGGAEHEQEGAGFVLDDGDDDGYPHYRGMQEVEDGTAPAPPAGLVIVDGFCAYLGGYVAEEVRRRGAAAVSVMSDHLLSCLKDENAKPFRAPQKGLPTHLWAAQLPFPVVGVLSESDAGLETAERMQADLCQGMEGGTGGVNAARRNKFKMNEALRAAGIPAVRQRTASSWAEIEAFAQEISGPDGDAWPPLVVKPLRGCASGDVFLCSTAQEARAALDTILGSPLYASPGAVNEEVLVQEFLRGTEYVVDTVSRAGVGKAVAIWKYDKRPANGAPFVYHATALRHAEGGEEAAVVEYAMQALDALGVRIGAAHIEIMMTEDGPLLIEYNGRWHLTDFRELCNECVGYNAIDATIDAYLDPKAFDALPAAPKELLRAGRVVHLVCHAHGTVTAVRHLEAIRALPSFRAMDVYGAFGEGQEVSPTVDIRSDAGWVHLSHDDPLVVEEDYARLVEMMPTMFEVDARTP